MKEKPQINPEWEKLGPDADMVFCPANAFNSINTGPLPQVHPIFQPILDDLTSRHRWEQERHKRNALKCCTREDQELIGVACVSLALDRQSKLIREALDWLHSGDLQRCAEALERALP